MSDPLTNLEIQDVLSSIRRLVSEDSRRRPADAAKARTEDTAGETATPAAQDAGKLMLTEALRVDDAGSAVQEAPDSLRETIAGDGVFEEGSARIAPGGAADADGGDILDWEEDALSDGGDAGSLEDTIAELEAAVAGIGGDFEPDGSEVAAGDDFDAELDEAFEDGFAVDQGDDPDVAELSQPVTGGGADDWLDAAGAEEKEAEDGDGPEDGPEDGDVLVLGAGDAEAEATDEGETTVLAEASGDAGDAATGGRDARRGVDWAAAAAMPLSRGRRDEEVPTTGADEAEARAEAPMRRLHLGAAEAVPPREADSAEAPDAGSDASSDLAADDSGAEPGGGTDGPGLFDAGGGDVTIDMDVLRDMVADILREELKGPLGERITRNVRMLVRHEIARALEGDD